MYQRLHDVFQGREDNFTLPFYWQHGDHTNTIPDEVERIYRSGCRALCVESRPTVISAVTGGGVIWMSFYMPRIGILPTSLQLHQL